MSMRAWQKPSKNMNTLTREKRQSLSKIDYLKIDQIITTVCADFDIDKKHIFGKCRRRKYVLPRHLCQYFVFVNSNLGTKMLGKIFNRNHASVHNAVNTIHNFVTAKYDNDIKSYINSKQWL
jgi:chromosomal replication initiation ATPase DnaA